MPPDAVRQATATRKPRYFYGWNIVAAAFMANLAYAEQLSSVLGLFMKPWQREFGWSRTAISAVQSIARLTEALAAPVVGPLIDRYGARVLMPIGAVIMGLSMLGVTRVDTIWQLYLLRGVMVAVGLTLIGGMVTSVAINNWFIRKRGRAIAIAGAGTNIGTIIMIPASVFIIATYGWRDMFVIFAVLVWIVVLLPSIILMRRRPEDMGLRPDGVAETQSSPGGQGQPVGEVTVAPELVWSRREALMTSSFWLLSASYAIDSMAFQGINISLAPYIQDLGYGQAVLSTVLTFRFIVQATVGLAMGFLAEHVHRVPIRVAPFLIQAVGALLFLQADEPVWLWVAVAVYSGGSAGTLIMQEVLWANYFGRFSLGKVRSMAWLVAFGFGAAGPIVMNAVFDILGSYRPAFMTIGVVFVGAAFLMGVVRPPKPRRYATEAGMISSGNH